MIDYFRDIKKDSNIKVRLNIARVIGFIIAYAIFGVAVFIFFRSYVCFLFLVVFILIPFISVYMLKLMLPHIKVNLFASETEITTGTELGIGIMMKNPTVFSSLSCKCHLVFKNLYYGDEASQVFNIPLVAKSDNKNPLYCKATNCGIIEVSLERCEIYDVLGFVKAVVDMEQAISITVMPISQTLDDIQKLGILSGYTDNEDDTQKGNEYSDTSNIREYIPGDRIKDIHWKLSAKRDILLVREHIKSCENQLVIWIDPSPRKKYCEQILALTYSVILFCLKENTLVKMMWFGKNTEKIEVRTINGNGELKDAFETYFRCGKGSAASDLRTLLLTNNYSYKNILRIGYNGSEVELMSYEI